MSVCDTLELHQFVPGLEKLLFLLQLQLQPKIFNYNDNISSLSNCNSVTITKKRFSKHCDQFIYIRSLEFCLRQHCEFVLCFYIRPIKARFFSILVFHQCLLSFNLAVHNFFSKQLSRMSLNSYRFQQHYGFS